MNELPLDIPDRYLKAFDAIPGENGWWKSSTRKTFVKAYYRIGLSGAFLPEQTIELLGKLYSAVAEDFGS